MKNIIKVCFLLLLLMLPFKAFADSVAPPRSYAVPSADNKYLFVMIASIEISQDGFAYGEEGKKEVQRIRAKYPASGMYLNDGSNKPLWTVDWYSYSVIVPSDGEHIIRRGPWATKFSDEAFTFYQQNNVVRSYKISDLVSSENLLPHSVSHFAWEESQRLDDETHTLTVNTLSKQKYVFDYLSGEIISGEKTATVQIVNNRNSLLIGLACAGILSLIVFLLIKWKANRFKSAV